MGEISPSGIPGGSLCILDTNVLLYADAGVSSQAQTLLRRVATREIEGILPQPMWQELMHKLMLVEAHSLGMITAANPARQLARKPALVRRLSAYREKVKDLAEMGLGFEACNRGDFLENVPRFQERYGILTNDSVLLAIASRLKADFIVTADMAMQSVKEVQVSLITDVRIVGH